MSGYPERHEPANPSEAPPVVLLHGGNVANWMWAPQVAALQDRLVLTPHLPGFGSRVAEEWPGMPAVADDLVGRVRDLGVAEPFDLVGLSLGGTVGLHVAARHPDNIRSAMVSGVLAMPPTIVMRQAARLQQALWTAPWFWRLQAKAYGLPADSHDTFVEHGLSVSKKTARAMLRDVYRGALPERLHQFDRPLLAVAGEREPTVVRQSLKRVQQCVRHAQIFEAANIHHVWNVEDVDYFNATLHAWLEKGHDPSFELGHLDSQR